MSAWKDHERRTAAALGTQRTGPTGVPTPDCQTDWLVVECKHRKSLPDWLKEALAQAKQHATAEQLAIAVLHEERKHDSLVVLSFKDFVAWFGQPPEEN